uniref:Transmembrane protein n=1 Tax=Myoviridae sp. ctIty1 TaxID=2827673 RepID=A0A8S5TH35_9CAUD|nr:MAG TPA: hypothetical protein [Myoviridae sp. ctIty1]
MIVNYNNDTIMIYLVMRYIVWVSNFSVFILGGKTYVQHEQLRTTIQWHGLWQ